MSTTNVTSSATAAANSAAAAGLTGSSTDATASAQAEKNEFLQILLTQLQNQNPMDPMKPEDFSSQLAQFSALEQQIDTNTKLDTLNTTMSKASVSPTSYLNDTVDYSSNTAPIQGGDATWTYSTTGATAINITVSDASGNTVYTGTGDTSTGTHTLTLGAGTDDVDGSPLTISIAATDASGNAVTPTIASRALITAVDETSTGVSLEANGYLIDQTLVTRIATPAATTSTSSTSSGSSSS